MHDTNLIDGNNTVLVGPVRHISTLGKDACLVLQSGIGIEGPAGGANLPTEDMPGGAFVPGETCRGVASLRRVDIFLKGF